VLVHPDFSRPFIVQPDASLFAVGEVLVQLDDQGRERPVSFRSKKLTPAEQKYAVYELEALGVVYCMCKWCHYLEGVRFTLVTDHRALLWLFSQPTLRGKLARWALDLQQFEFDVSHRPGKFHFVPDAVSRLRRLDEFENNDEQDLQTDEVSDKAFELGSCVPNLERKSGKMLPNEKTSPLTTKYALNSSLDKNVFEEDVFGEREAASLTCVAVVQRRNELNLFNESLELKFLNSVQSAAPHWAPRVTSKGVFKSQADKFTHSDKYEDSHWHRLDCRDAYEHSPLTVENLVVMFKKCWRFPAPEFFWFHRPTTPNSSSCRPRSTT
jgi:hypothetical protein